ISPSSNAGIGTVGITGAVTRCSSEQPDMIAIASASMMTMRRPRAVALVVGVAISIRCLRGHTAVSCCRRKVFLHAPDTIQTMEQAKLHKNPGPGRNLVLR